MDKSALKNTLLNLRKEMLKQIKKGKGDAEVEIEVEKVVETPEKNYTIQNKYMNKDGRTFKEVEKDTWRPLDELEEEDSMTAEYKRKKARAEELEKGLAKGGNLKPSKPMMMEKPKRRGK